ncbi:MAG: dTDP-4-dehydrorhamnose 3,5-epimerase family protein [Candidatus Omnitrophica bacterium]|jgi:dTDP-4-dehydrorhamnose 3,5-epimerase|nr:dTDP-4-dehydrorhamnose 3,5-epimerase family protein [Candidatus Omnitrophota bacterium]
MIIHDTKFEKAKLLEIPIFRDFRGDYVETFNNNIYKSLDVNVPFVQDSFSTSRKDVLRGFHGDNETWKLIQVVSGEVYEVIVDLNMDSPTYLEWQAFHISERNRYQLLIPPGFGNAMLALTDNVVYYYKQTTFYDRSKQFTIPWDDPTLKVYWPISKPILSMRDATAQCLKRK